MSICNGDNEQKLKIKVIFSKYKGHNSAENYSTKPKFELTLYILVTNLSTKFQLKISMYDRENERKLNLEGRKGVTLYAPAISWRGHKNYGTK